LTDYILSALLVPQLLMHPFVEKTMARGEFGEEVGRRLALKSRKAGGN